MAFKDVSGNSRVKKILIKALQKNKVPNSLLFCGPEGTGKREMALVLAKALNCQKKKMMPVRPVPPANRSMPETFLMSWRFSPRGMFSRLNR